jgi:hypothetical protein
MKLLWNEQIFDFGLRDRKTFYRRNEENEGREQNTERSDLIFELRFLIFDLREGA